MPLTPEEEDRYEQLYERSKNADVDDFLRKVRHRVHAAASNILPSELDNGMPTLFESAFATSTSRRRRTDDATRRRCRPADATSRRCRPAVAATSGRCRTTDATNRGCRPS